MELSRENQLISQLIDAKPPPHPFCDDATISRISQTIATIIYSPKTTKKQRQSMIDLIQKWTGLSHPVNQDVFINVSIKNPECLQPFDETVRKKYDKYMETKLKQGLIDALQKRQFDQNLFEVNIPVKSYQNLSLIDTLILKDDLILETTDINEDCVSGAILSLLQLNVSNVLLDKLFDDLVKLTPKPSVSDFVKYIWTKSLNGEIRVKLLQKFKFLYEKPVLQCFCRVLMDETTDIEMKDVLLCCSNDIKLSTNVFQLLDTLLQMSNFDLRVLEMINLVKKQYFHSLPLPLNT